MKTKKEISSLLESYLNNELNDKDKAEILRLMDANSTIKEEFLLRQKINTAVQKKEVLELRKKLHELSMNREDNNIVKETKPVYSINWYQAAAIVILMIGLAFIIYNQSIIKEKKISITPESIEQLQVNILENESLASSSESNTLSNIENQHDDKQNIYSEAKTKDELINRTNILIALNEKESDYFESFIDTYRAENINAIRPKPSEEIEQGSEILFQWSSIREDSVILSIFTNSEEKIYSFEALRQYRFREELPKGLYYWKLESEDDLLHLNKFFIR